jgi:hypothetical protein
MRINVAGGARDQEPLEQVLSVPEAALIRDSDDTGAG